MNPEAAEWKSVVSADKIDDDDVLWLKTTKTKRDELSGLIEMSQSFILGCNDVQSLEMADKQVLLLLWLLTIGLGRLLELKLHADIEDCRVKFVETRHTVRDPVQRLFGILLSRARQEHA